MIKVVFHRKNELISGFNINGHATLNEDDFEGSLVCAAVSSAAEMAANTLTEIVGDNSVVRVSDGTLSFECSNPQACSDVLRGLLLHLNELEKQYPERISIITK